MIFNLNKKYSVCELMGTGVAAIFGPLNRFTSEHVQSICDTKEIPHIYGRWEPSQPRGKGINLFPHADTLAMVCEIREQILPMLSVLKNYFDFLFGSDRILFMNLNKSDSDTLE